jgi:carbon monoxide dehydrogenase subunit G
LNANFTIQNGILTLKPNQFKINGMSAGISGTFNLDKQIDLVLSLDVPKEKLGNNLNSVLNNLAGVAQKLDLGKVGETVKTKFKITGNALNPKIKPILLGSEGQTLTETVKEVVETKITEVKNEALDKAQAEADKLIAIATVQKEKLVQEAEKLAQEAKDKAKLGADELLKQAGDNPLKKLAAQKAANKIEQEGDKKAIQLVDTAKKKGDDIVLKAQEQGNALIESARNKGNK